MSTMSTTKQFYDFSQKSTSSVRATTGKYATPKLSASDNQLYKSNKPPPWEKKVQKELESVAEPFNSPQGGALDEETGDTVQGFMSRWTPQMKTEVVLAEETKKILQDAVKTGSTSVNALKPMLDQLTSTFEKFSNIGSGFSIKKIANMPLMLIFVGSAIQAWNDRDEPKNKYKDIAIAVGTFIVGLNAQDLMEGAISIVTDIVSWLKSKWSTQSKPQGVLCDAWSRLGEGAEWLKNLIKLIYGTISEWFGSKFQSWSDFAKLFGAAVLIQRSWDSIWKIYDWLLDVVMYIVNFFRTKVFKMDAIHRYKTDVKEVVEWLDEVHKFGDICLQKKPDVNRKNLDKIMRMKQKGIKLSLIDHGSKQVNDTVRRDIGIALKVISTVLESFAPLATSSQNTKAPAECYMLGGPPGSAKSTLITAIGEGFCASYLDDDELENLYRNPRDYIYAREIEHEYADGYTNQIVMTYDDF